MNVDSAPVVWGGSLRDPDEVLERVLDNEDSSGEAVISVRWSAPMPDEQLDEYLRRVASEGKLPHGKIQTTNRSELERVGIGLVEDRSEGQPPHHYHAVFPSPPTLERAEAFLSVFSAPFPNPARTE